MNALDAAFAHALYDATLRRWLTLSYIIGLSVEREWETLEPRMKAALMVGAAQLLFLDRTPSHAAVDESVNWAKRAIRTGAGGMVNAVLRSTAALARLEDGGMERRATWSDGLDEVPMADGRALVLREPVMPKDPLRRLCAATSVPLALLRSWTKQMPLHDVKRVALHGVGAPPTILNTAHLADASVLEGVATPHEIPGHHVFTGERARLIELLNARQDVWAQDPASSEAVASVSDLTPSLVVDACAGNGTKTRQLAFTFPNARIVATDVNDARRATLRRVFEGHERVSVIEPRELEGLANAADLVLLDVPCSNTGVLARRVEARYRHDDARVRELAGIQRQLIADSVRMLARGGVSGAARRGQILYSTCSLDERENAEQARWADRWHALRPSRESLRLPRGGPGEPPTRWADGSYSVLLG